MSVLRRLVLYFVNDVEVDLAIKSSVKSIVEHIPQAVKGKARISIIVDGFDGRKFTSLDPVHQLPQTATLIQDFLDFVIEEGSLGVFNALLEFLLILEAS